MPRARRTTQRARQLRPSTHSKSALELHLGEPLPGAAGEEVAPVVGVYKVTLVLSARPGRTPCLAQFGDRVVLHFLPPYCPNDNRIERVWLDLHANVTRNHRCKSIEDLMGHVHAFLRAYNRRSKLNPSLKLAAGVSGSRSVV